MASPNLSDITVTTLNNRSSVIADNVTKNNALLSYLSRKGNIKPLDGGEQIYKGFSYQENGNFGFYSGYDLLPVAAQQVISGAVFDWKQAAVSVVISGLEQLKNSGKERIKNLLDERIGVAEDTMMNNLSSSIYSDGTGYGGKEITGLNAAVSATPSTGTYGGVDRAAWSFWRNQTNTNASYSSTTIYNDFMTLWLKCVRGSDKPDLIVADNNVYSTYVQSLQAQQRFTDPRAAEAGFEAVKFMSADVVFDGGIGGFCPANTAFFLNLKYLFWQPHKSRNMVPLSPDRRAPVNQDATVAILAFAGNLTSNGAQFQGRFIGS